MKKKMNGTSLTSLYLVLGIAAQALYRWLYTYLEDEVSYLLPRGTLPEILLWILTAAAIAGAFLLTRNTSWQPSGKVITVMCDALFAFGIASLLLENAKGPGILVLLYRIFCCIAALSLAASAVMHGLGKKVPFVLEVCPCVLCLLHLLICYQLWSEVPQLMNYVMGLGAVLCLALTTYFHMAYEADLPEKAWYHGVMLLGVYFCCAASAQEEFPVFFSAAAVWLVGNSMSIQCAEE